MTSPGSLRPPVDGLLGHLSVEEFLARHWQKRPLLVRGAVERPESVADWPMLRALAQQDDVQSRLVRRRGTRWTVAHGPFDPEEMPDLDKPGWTVLVQGVDLHVEPARRLLERFRFLPDVRIDDLMISTAGHGGGVGPHLDSYDVFLVQLMGRRRWQIAPPGDTRHRPGQPLKLLAHFEPTAEHVLEPGDMLYLPAGWGHDGVALGACMTGSIGFRAPSRSEFLRALFEDCLDADDSFGAAPADGAPDATGSPRAEHSRDPRYRDQADALQPAHPARIPADLERVLRHWAGSWRFSARRVDDFIGRFLTEPKPDVFFLPPRRPLSRESFRDRLAERGVRIDRRTRMAYRGTRIFINGESFAPGRRAAAQLGRIADERGWPPGAGPTRLDDETSALLHDWYRNGWVRLD